jgi:hypothetical protein
MFKISKILFIPAHLIFDHVRNEVLHKVEERNIGETEKE